uniref:Putative major capsid protein n=1 Tax=viral metagenome TaxID=1070528 RepID=A0A6M3K4B0_9ZZZZ
MIKRYIILAIVIMLACAGHAKAWDGMNWDPVRSGTTVRAVDSTGLWLVDSSGNQFRVDGGVTLFNSSGTKLFGVDGAGNVYISSTASVGTPVHTAIDSTSGVSTAQVSFNDGTSMTTAGGGNPNISETGASAYVTGDPGRASGTTQFAVGSGGVADVVVKGDGKVGIGTASPSQKLHVSGDVLATTYKTASYGDIISAYTGNFKISVGDSGDVLFKNWNALPMAFEQSVAGSPSRMLDLDDTEVALYTSNTKRIVIDSTGNVGIGTTTPSSLLELSKGATGNAFLEFSKEAVNAYIGSGDADQMFTGIASGDLGIRAGESKKMVLGSGNNMYMTIANTGNVGIGTTSPGEKLSVIGGVSIGQVDPMSGTSFFMAIASGASPEGVPVNGAMFYVISGEMWVADDNGNNTQLSPHDPITGEVYINSFNSYTGKGLKYYPVSGNSEVYTVPIYDWEADQIAKQKAEFVKAYQAENIIEEAVTKDYTETYDETEKIRTGEITKYRFDDGKVVPYPEPIYEDQVKQKTKLKTNHRIDKDTGKVFKKTIPTETDAMAAFNSKDAALILSRQAKWDNLPPFLKVAIQRPE